MIAIIDYGVGNLYSLKSSLSFINQECVITNEKRIINNCNHIILPGVGAFGDASKKLKESGMDKIILDNVNSGKPLLGICLGMQLLYKKSTEYGEHYGLGIVNEEITSIHEELEDKTLKVPHMGWNNIEETKDSSLMKYTKENDYVYYVHSYYAKVSENTIAFSEYGNIKITSVVQVGNVYGTQFHPEKSGTVGLNILKAFCEIK